MSSSQVDWRNPAETFFTYTFSIHWINKGGLVSVYQPGEEIERSEAAVFSLIDSTGISEGGSGEVATGLR